jgi:hypothetical protein
MKAFLENCFSTYIKLLENSCVIQKKIEDQLITLPSIIRITPNSSETSDDIEKNLGKTDSFQEESFSKFS